VATLTKHLNVPHIAHIHELQKSIERWVGDEKMLALRDNSALIIAASNPVADNLFANHRIPKGRIKVVEESIRCTNVRPLSVGEKRKCKLNLGLQAKSKMVLGCGTTDWRKAPDLFLEVAERVTALYKDDVEFVWVGGETKTGELAHLRRLVLSKGLSKHVKLVGSVANPLPYMLAADLFLLPSREDPFPLVCLEAADCGVPTICFADAGGMPEFVGTDCGAVVPYLDVDRMASQVLSFLNNRTALRSVGKSARERVRHEFDVSVKGRLILDLLRGVCSPAQGNSSKGALVEASARNGSELR
jgi:glycosyltransferase involved in cell wall biosynthesis